MQNFIVSLLLLSCSIPVFAGSMTVASSVLREAPTHQFVNLDAEPLWTSEVRRIDVSKQAYERLPAVIAPETLVAEAAAKASSPELATADATPQSVNDTPSSSDATELARNWCSAKYRSYSPVDNTYQPYGGGERKACVAPEELTAPATIQTASADTNTLDIGHIQWCMERYSSYREDDNSYQPYSGPRKKCLPPEQQSASNRYGMVAQEYH